MTDLPPAVETGNISWWCNRCGDGVPKRSSNPFLDWGREHGETTECYCQHYTFHRKIGVATFKPDGWQRSKWKRTAYAPWYWKLWWRIDFFTPGRKAYLEGKRDD